MTEKQALGSFILAKRQERGLTQKQLAEKLYVTESAVSKWERGKSYPDITVITALCDALGITEHELIMAQPDLERHDLEKKAGQYERLRKIYLAVFLLSYTLAIITCFICNLAVQHTLSWFFIVLSSIALAFSLTVLPVIIKSRKAVLTLAASYASLILLLAVCCVYVKGDWFWVSLSAVTFGLCVVFLPFLVRSFPRPFNRHKALICLLADTALLLLLLAVTLKPADFTGAALPIIGYVSAAAYVTLLFTRYVKLPREMKGFLVLTLFAVWGFFLDGVLNAVLEGSFTFLRADFGVWSGDTLNDNIYILICGAMLLAGLVSLICGLVGHRSGDKEKRK